MANNANGSNAPAPGPGQRAGKDERSLSLAREQQQVRTRHRNRKNHSQSVPQLDGTVSDSVTNPIASPQSKKQPRPQRQSVANGALPQHNGNMGRANGQKARPVSLGGPMLPATPAKEQAYAGPTFHNSPAPASLPVPKFFSKSVPNGGNPLQARMEGEKTPEKQESSPEPDIVESAAGPREAVQSPLDLFFKADRAEKERSRSSSMLSPEMATRRPPATEPRNPFQKSGKSISLAEMDGESDDMPSPRTVPRNNRPAPVERAHSSPNVKPEAGGHDKDREAYTKSLKDLLFSNMNGANAQATTPPQAQQPQQRAQSDAQIFNTPSPNQRSASGPSTPAPSTDQANHYALHYGNRANLSPLFKAARNETPTRPSSLRQELPNGDHAPFPQAAPPPQPRHMPHIDPNSFSRDFLDQQIRSSKPASLPQLPFMNGSPGRPVSSGSGPGASAMSQQGAQGSVSPDSANGTTPSAAAPNKGGSRDIRSMEDDLRRILKLSVGT